MNTSKVDLLSNAGTGNGAEKPFRGGKAAFMAEATFGGGNVKLQTKAPNGTWFDVTDSTLSAAGMAVLDLPPGGYRAVSTTATAVYASLISVPQP